MAKIDEYASHGAKKKGGMDEHKSANWRGIKLQLTTRNVLQPFQIQNFQKLLNIRNDDEMIHLPTLYNLLLRAFQSDPAKQRDIKNTFVKSFGSDSIVGGRDFNTLGVDQAKLKKFEAEMTATPEVDSMVDHIVKSASLIKSATASGIYDTESVITNLNTLMADIQKVVSILSDQGEPQPVPGEEQPGGDAQPTEGKKKQEQDAKEMGIPNPIKDFIAATAQKYGFRVQPGLGGALDFIPTGRNYPTLFQEMNRDGQCITKLDTGFSGKVGAREASAFTTSMVNALKALEEIQKKYPREVLP